MRVHVLCSTLILASGSSAALAATQGTSGPPLPDEALAALGFDAGERRAVRAGRTVYVGLDSSHDAELAVAAATTISVTSDSVTQSLRSGDVDVLDGAVLRVWTLDQLPSRLELGGDEARALLDDDGSAFNLSAGERNRFRSLARRVKARNAERNADARSRVLDLYTECVFARAWAIEQRGLASVLPYRRDGDEAVDPAARLQRALAAETILAMVAPGFIATPPAGTGSLDRRVTVVLRTVEDRPCAIVAERLESTHAGITTILERHAFVGHTYDAMQLVTVCLPDGDDRTLVVVVNRTSASRLDAFGRGVRQRVGRGRLGDELEAHLDRVRRAAVEE